MKNILPAEYSSFLLELKERIHKAQYAALKVVNKELIALYWDIGTSIVSRQDQLTGAKRLWKRWRRIYRMNFRGFRGFPREIFGICGTFTWHIGTI